MKSKFPTLLTLFITFSTLMLQAQGIDTLTGVAGQQSTTIEVTLGGEIRAKKATRDPKWATSLRRIRTIDRDHYSSELERIKAIRLQEKRQTATAFAPEEAQHAASLLANNQKPAVQRNFQANWMDTGSTPADNSMAVSKGGYIVSANNDGIEYYTSNGTFLYFDYWRDFFNDNRLTSSIYDPKVIYDPQADRFILVLLHGTSAATSRILFCFSKSNDPRKGWWVYHLTGNPLNNGCWMDYPNIAVSSNDLFFTGNLYNDNRQFNQSIIYQMSKFSGYRGQNLSFIFYNNLNTEAIGAFNLVPAAYGHPNSFLRGMHFVSNSANSASAVKLWTITDDLGNNPQLRMSLVSVTPYNVGGPAEQRGSTDVLSNGDCRIQNAFYLNGIVHYVFTSNLGNGWNGINYHRLSVNTLTDRSSTFGLVGSYDYCYPAVAPFSTSPNDQSVMIAFLRSSSLIYPEVRVVLCDNNFEWSNSVQVKAGETHVDLSGTQERWGDYTGIARQHGSNVPRVWLAGSYGAVARNLRSYKTWIAEVGVDNGLQEVVVASKHPNVATNTAKVALYPNPTYDMMHITFDIVEQAEVTIAIYDLSGKRVKLLYQDTPKPGENRLTFNKGALAAGTYSVVISTDSKIIKSEKVVILN